MKNRWNDNEAAAIDGPLGECVYASRLLGAEPSLVLHGGGNSSIKRTETDVFGEETEALWVKASGWDLADIEPRGFARVRLDAIRRLAQLETLSDLDMENELRTALLDASASTPSVEAIIHAVLPAPSGPAHALRRSARHHQHGRWASTSRVTLRRSRGGGALRPIRFSCRTGCSR